MCQTPNKLANGVQVACHLCWQCINAKVDDWCGRCLAEMRTVKAVNAITLTYGRVGPDGSYEEKTKYGEADHPAAAVLTYSHVQKYFKSLRDTGYPCRYFVTGEYGSRKGRAHWHIVIFWLDRVPEHVVNKNFMEAHWPHGWSHWTKPGFAAFRYNMKYINKDIGVDERQGHVSMSKKPPLGAEYFAQLARKYAEQGLSPQGSTQATAGMDGWNIGRFHYTFPEAKRKDGSPVIFHLRGVSEQLFLQAFVDHWEHLYGNREWPNSKLVDEFCDPGSWKKKATDGQ